MEGNPTPTGVMWTEHGWNFTLYSRHATAVTLLLYGPQDFIKPVIALKLDPLRNKTGRIWHCFLPWMEGARYYAYRVEGQTDAFHRFDAQKVLLAPFADQVFFPPEFSRAAAMKPGANDGRAPMGVLPVKQDNAANGQDNTDGSDNNLSWNCGWEGDARAPAEVLASLLLLHDDRSVRRTYRVSSDRRRDDTLVAYLLERVLRLAATRKTAMVLLMNTEVLNASFIKPEAWASMNGR